MNCWYTKPLPTLKTVMRDSKVGKAALGFKSEIVEGEVREAISITEYIRDLYKLQSRVEVNLNPNKPPIEMTVKLATTMQ